ncbi:hypothetical protein fugu_013712 [Takifugu bimaculatus]|uniref:SH2 domain-containing protein n=1 Tax=Takifugu bimaculatus TaxID=433685 RepID=A0A4Z2C4U9_9TELE|nr:hypothetical protein fugu_013712 [Takifugu bimaculatus]
MATAAWYHRDISRVHAEELLARAGKDGSYLVRDSESVPGAYALCLLFQRHVHTYRVLPDADGLLAVQSGVALEQLLYIVALQGVWDDETLATEEQAIYGCNFLSHGVERPQIPWQLLECDDEKPPPAPSSGNMASVPAAPAKPPAHTLFLDGFQELNTCSSSNEVVALLKDYVVNTLPLDIENVHKGAATLHHLRSTLGAACQGLHGEIDLTLSSLETLAKVFDHPSCSLTHNKGQGPEMEMDSLLCKISALVSLLSSLEKRVLKALQDAVANHNLAVQQNAPPPEPTPPNTAPTKTPARLSPVNSFQVKMLRYGRQTASVDVDAGVLLFDRKAGSFGVERISHERILQIVKLQSKIRMVIDSHHNTPREMTFESARKRDAFCHLLQLMKMRHSQQSEPDVISVFVGTWNMGGSPPPRALQTWMTCCGLGHTPDEATALLPHDIYAVGTQENPQGEKEWTEHIKDHPPQLYAN